MDRPAARAAYCAALPDDAPGQVNLNVSQILHFTQDMQPGELVFICGRYDSVGPTDRDVYIYGVARTIEVNGQCYYFDTQSAWHHRCKRHAQIQPIEQSLPRSLICEALQRGSFVPTIVRVDQQGFDALAGMLRRQLGFVLSV
jgi:hypothetical protein